MQGKPRGFPLTASKWVIQAAHLAEHCLTWNLDVETLVRWIVDYFTEETPKSTNVNDALKAASPVIITDRMPIVLQHSGHSRTVVGYEKSGNKVNLLVFDPGR